MKLDEVRKIGIEYCAKNNCNYVCISHEKDKGFYMTEDEDKHTVFYMNKNGSLNPCRSTEYAVNFHKELKRRKKNRRKFDKRKFAEEYNRSYETKSSD